MYQAVFSGVKITQLSTYRYFPSTCLTAQPVFEMPGSMPKTVVPCVCHFFLNKFLRRQLTCLSDHSCGPKELLTFLLRVKQNTSVSYDRTNLRNDPYKNCAAVLRCPSTSVEAWCVLSLVVKPFWWFASAFSQVGHRAVTLTFIHALHPFLVVETTKISVSRPS